MTFLEEAKALYRSINVKPAITASGSTTAYGGTKLRTEVMDAMNKAAKILLEYTDFECFSKSNSDVKTFNCDVRKAHWNFEEEKWIFTITADRFLRNMVRAVVGTLLDVGMGKMPPEYVRQVIASKDRGEAGASVPAKGLYLTQVLYPKEIFDE